MSGTGIDGTAWSSDHRRVDWDLLADHLAGVLDGTPEYATVTHLIATDPAWSCAAIELSEALGAVSADLAQLPPPRMPDDVVAHLDATLSGLAAAGGTAPARATSTGATSTGATSTGATSTSATSTGAAAPAGTATSTGTTAPAGSAPGWRSTDAGAPGRREGRADRSTRPGGPTRPAGRRRLARWAAPLGAAAALFAFVALGPGLIADLDRAMDGAGDAGSADAPMFGATEGDARTTAAPLLTATGLDYNRELAKDLGITIDSPPPAPLSAEPGEDDSDPADGPETLSGPRAPDQAVPPAGLARLWDDPGALLVCLDGVLAAQVAPGGTVRVVDFAAFEGEPALVISLTDGDGANWVRVTGPGCGTPAGNLDSRYHTRVTE